MLELKALKFILVYGLVIAIELCFGYDPATCIQCRDSHMCNPPDCFCCRDTMPISTHDIPQMVFFTFDDAVNPQVATFYRELFDSKRKNPNGCPISMTLFVSHKNTVYDLVKEFYDKGMEIASHSVTHGHMNTRTFIREARLQKENIAKQAGIPANKINGWRSPFLEPVGDLQPSVLKDLGYEYDATLTITRKDPTDKAITPFTLDFGWPYDCKIKQCPTQSHKGFWEVPVVSVKDYLEKYDCVYVDGCNNPPPTENLAFQFLWDNFQKYYTTNKAPMGINMHASWFYYPDRKAAMDRFIKELVKLDDVYIISIKQVIEWLKDPTPLHDIKNFKPWQCQSDNNTNSVTNNFVRFDQSANQDVLGRESNSQRIREDMPFRPQNTRSGLFMPSVQRTPYPSQTNRWQTLQPPIPNQYPPTAMPVPMPPLVPNLPMVNFWWQRPAIIQNVQLQEQQQHEEILRRQQLEEQRRRQAEIQRQAEEQARLQEQKRGELRQQELARQAQVQRQRELERQRQEQQRLEVIKQQELERQKTLMLERQKELERRRLIEIEKQKEIEAQKKQAAAKQEQLEKQRSLEEQRQKEVSHTNPMRQNSKQVLFDQEYSQDFLAEPPPISVPASVRQPLIDTGNGKSIQDTIRNGKKLQQDINRHQFTQTPTLTTKSDEQILEETFRTYIARKLDEILKLAPGQRTQRLQRLSMTELRALQAELRNRLVKNQLQKENTASSRTERAESQPIINEIQPIRIGMFLSEFHSTNSVTRTKITKPEDVQHLKTETTNKLLNALSTVKSDALTKTTAKRSSTEAPTTVLHSTRVSEWRTLPPKTPDAAPEFSHVLFTTVSPSTNSDETTVKETSSPEIIETSTHSPLEVVTEIFSSPSTTASTVARSPGPSTTISPSLGQLKLVEEFQGLSGENQDINAVSETKQTTTSRPATAAVPAPNVDVARIPGIDTMPSTVMYTDTYQPLDLVTLTINKMFQESTTPVPLAHWQDYPLTTTQGPKIKPIWNIDIATDKPAPWQKWLIKSPEMEIAKPQQVITTIRPQPAGITFFSVHGMQPDVVPKTAQSRESGREFTKDSLHKTLFSSEGIMLDTQIQKILPNNDKGVDGLLVLEKGANNDQASTSFSSGGHNTLENAVNTDTLGDKMTNNSMRQHDVIDGKQWSEVKEPPYTLGDAEQSLQSFNVGQLSALRSPNSLPVQFSPNFQRQELVKDNVIEITKMISPSTPTPIVPKKITKTLTLNLQHMFIPPFHTGVHSQEISSLNNDINEHLNRLPEVPNQERLVANVTDERVQRPRVQRQRTMFTGRTAMPTRISPTWLTSQQTPEPTCEQMINCLRPNCVCRSFSAPEGLSKADIPQIVTITIDGSLNFHTYAKIRSLFSGNRKNPNGCKVRGTVFVTDSGSSYKIANALHSNSIEIGMMGVSSRPYTNANDLQMDIERQRRQFVNQADIPPEDIKGWRSPGFSPVGDEQYRSLANQSLYDSTLKVTGTSNGNKKVWPYTLDFGWQEVCEHDSCPIEAHPGVWEVPVIPFTGPKNSSACEYIDACTSQPGSEQETVDFLMENFNSFYKTNKAPFSIRLKQMWFHWYYRENFAALLKFLDKILDFGDVYITSVSDLIDWMTAPKTLTEIKNSKWSC